jgi:hypothetical protein
MKTLVTCIKFILFGTMLMGLLEGCTLVGASIGAIVDSKKADRYSITVRQIDTLKSDTRIVCELRNGSKIRGTYKRTAEPGDSTKNISGNELLYPVRVDQKSILLLTPGGYTVKAIPVNEIESIKVGRPKNGVFVGLGVGLAIDAAITAAIIASGPFGGIGSGLSF